MTKDERSAKPCLSCDRPEAEHPYPAWNDECRFIPHNWRDEALTLRAEVERLSDKVEACLASIIERQGELERVTDRAEAAERERAICLDRAQLTEPMLREAQKDRDAYRAALGYSMPPEANGFLSDGTVPTCGMCDAKLKMLDTAKTRAEAAERELAELKRHPLGPSFEAGMRTMERERDEARAQLAAAQQEVERLREALDYGARLLGDHPHMNCDPGAHGPDATGPCEACAWLAAIHDHMKFTRAALASSPPRETK